MSLAGVMVQAGRHFADSLNMEVFSGNATRRQEATKLAWMLVAMIRPELNEEFLEINDPGDGDSLLRYWELEPLLNCCVFRERSMLALSERFQPASTTKLMHSGALAEFLLKPKAHQTAPQYTNIVNRSPQRSHLCRNREPHVATAELSGLYSQLGPRAHLAGLTWKSWTLKERKNRCSRNQSERSLSFMPDASMRLRAYPKPPNGSTGLRATTCSSRLIRRSPNMSEQTQFQSTSSIEAPLYLPYVASRGLFGGRSGRVEPYHVHAF